MNLCPLNNWYTFNTCKITTCKYSSSKLKTGCMRLERKNTEGYKSMSDGELFYYKFTEEEDIKKAASVRRKAVSRVKSILVLHRFLDYIRENFEPLFFLDEESKELTSILSMYPFNVKELKVEYWMLFYIFDDSVFHRFTNSNRSGDVKAFTCGSVLSMSKRVFFSLKNIVDSEKEKCKQSQLQT